MASISVHDSGVSGDKVSDVTLGFVPVGIATSPQDSVSWSISFSESLSV